MYCRPGITTLRPKPENCPYRTHGVLAVNWNTSCSGRRIPAGYEEKKLWHSAKKHHTSPPQRDPGVAHEDVQHKLRTTRIPTVTGIMNRNLHEKRNRDTGNDSTAVTHRNNCSTQNVWTQRYGKRALQIHTTQRYLRVVDIVNKEYTKKKPLANPYIAGIENRRTQKKGKSKHRKKKHCHNE